VRHLDLGRWSRPRKVALRMLQRAQHPSVRPTEGRSTLQWDEQRIIAALRAWHDRYGKSATTTELSVSYARGRTPRDGGVRLRRLQEGWDGGAWPPASVVQHHFGTLARANRRALPQRQPACPPPDTRCNQRSRRASLRVADSERGFRSPAAPSMPQGATVGAPERSALRAASHISSNGLGRTACCEGEGVVLVEHLKARPHLFSDCLCVLCAQTGGDAATTHRIGGRAGYV
jgi:hypothetical protein